MNIHALGWNDHFARHYAPYADQGYRIGRIAAEHTHLYRVFIGDGGPERSDILASISGKMRHEACRRLDYPTVGDWVVLTSMPGDERAIIHAILPRKSLFCRKAAGTTPEEQAVAANIDTVFIVTALNHDFNLRRIERYVTLAWESGARPVVVLSKADLCDDQAAKRADATAVAPGVPVYVVSSQRNEGIAALQAYLLPGQTVTLLGSSGAGKSTLINCFCGEERQKVQAIRHSDDRGRHTTTYRELVPLATGAVLIDTPGMRELHLWDAEEGLVDTFEDIHALSGQCRFVDCQHDREPGCAVRQALEEGRLDLARWESYAKLKKELAYLDRRENQTTAQAEKQKWKKIRQQQKVIAKTSKVHDQ